jgi:hypothetical protein
MLSQALESCLLMVELMHTKTQRDITAPASYGGYQPAILNVNQESRVEKFRISLLSGVHSGISKSTRCILNSRRHNGKLSTVDTTIPGNFPVSESLKSWIGSRKLQLIGCCRHCGLKLQWGTTTTDSDINSPGYDHR